MQGHPDGSSVRNIFVGSFTEEETVAGNGIFEGGFKLSASEASKKLDIPSSEYRGVIGYKLGRNWVVIGEQVIEGSLAIYDK